MGAIKSIEEIGKGGLGRASKAQMDNIFKDMVACVSSGGYEFTTCYYYCNTLVRNWCREEDAEWRADAIMGSGGEQWLQYYMVYTANRSLAFFLKYINAVEKAHNFKGAKTRIVRSKMMKEIDIPYARCAVLEMNKEWLMSPTMVQLFTFLNRFTCQSICGSALSTALIDTSKIDGSNLLSIFDVKGINTYYEQNGDEYSNLFLGSYKVFNMIVKERHSLFDKDNLTDEWEADTALSKYGDEAIPFGLFSYSGAYAMRDAIKDKKGGAIDERCYYFKFITKGDKIRKAWSKYQ